MNTDTNEIFAGWEETVMAFNAVQDHQMKEIEAAAQMSEAEQKLNNAIVALPEFPFSNDFQEETDPEDRAFSIGKKRSWLILTLVGNGKLAELLLHPAIQENPELIPACDAKAVYQAAKDTGHAFLRTESARLQGVLKELQSLLFAPDSLVKAWGDIPEEMRTSMRRLFILFDVVDLPSTHALAVPIAASLYRHFNVFGERIPEQLWWKYSKDILAKERTLGRPEPFPAPAENKGNGGGKVVAPRVEGYEGKGTKEARPSGRKQQLGQGAAAASNGRRSNRTRAPRQFVQEGKAPQAGGLRIKGDLTALLPTNGTPVPPMAISEQTEAASAN